MESLVSCLGFPLGLNVHGCGWSSYGRVWRQERWRHSGGRFDIHWSLSWERRKGRDRRHRKASAKFLFEVDQAATARVSSPEGAESSATSSEAIRESLLSGRHLLCLSNGHGEDAIAITILKELQALSAEKGEEVSIEGLPLVGVGSAYSRAGIPLVGPAEIMPSGGFIYMDPKQLVGDVKAGLLSLLLQQWQAVTAWTDRHPGGTILAVGDVLPLAVAWLASKRRKQITRRAKQPGGQSGVRYAFVGTAKSEFYVRDGEGRLLGEDRLGLVGRLLYKDGVHFPWERALMADDDCRLVAPRDGLTAQVLRQGLPPSARAKVKDAGNPMMDGLHPTGLLDPVLAPHGSARIVVILPGSRAPEVHENWNLLLRAASATSASLSASTTSAPLPATSAPLSSSATSACPSTSFTSAPPSSNATSASPSASSTSAAPLSAGGRLRTVFVAPIVPSLPLAPFAHALARHGWCHVSTPPLHISTPCHVSAPPSSATWQSNGNPPLSTGPELEGRKWAVGEHGEDVRVQVFELGEGRGGGVRGVPPPLLVLLRGGFADCVHVAEAGIAMAGTATEQLVGLGKPVFTLPGKGPQFSATFAEAQSRLLGRAVFYCEDVDMLQVQVKEVLGNRELLAQVAEEGHRRMGDPGAAKKLSMMVWSAFW